MSSSSDAVLVPEQEVAAASEALAWGTCPELYQSYGMVAMKGMPPALTDAVEAAPSFTVLSPPMGLDFFAVLDGRGLGAAAAGGESERLLALLRDAVAGQVYLELCSDSPRFLDGTPRDVVGWWTSVIREAFRAFHEEVAACSQGEHSVDAPAAAPATDTAIVALVLERYLVIGNCGASKAVLSRDGELVELGSDSEHMANRRGDENKSVGNASGGRVAEATCKVATAPRTTTDDASGISAAPAAAADLVDVVAVEREAHDEFLILASAALWDKVTPAAACAHVRRRLGRTSRVTMPWETRITDAEGSPTLLAEELVKKALHAGSRDNVSVGLVGSGTSGLQGARRLATSVPPSLIYQRRPGHRVPLKQVKEGKRQEEEFVNQIGSSLGLSGSEYGPAHVTEPSRLAAAVRLGYMAANGPCILLGLVCMSFVHLVAVT